MEKSNKKWTKDRNKNLNYQLKKQLEFYFSDANLQKDRFLKKEIISSKDGFVDVEMFTSFNKIRLLTDNLAHIITAIQSSSLIKMHEDGKRVGRVKPFEEPKDVDERTVYVELLPAHATVEWLERVFKECGKVVYVSLPKFKSTRDLKGFAFVEFEEEAQADIACKTMNRPPPTLMHTRPGVFPKGSKSEKELEKKLHKTAASNYMDVTQVDVGKEEIKGGDDDDDVNKKGGDDDDDVSKEGVDDVNKVNKDGGDDDNDDDGVDDGRNKNEVKMKRKILSDDEDDDEIKKKRKLNEEDEEEDGKIKKKLKLEEDGDDDNADDDDDADGGDDDDEGEIKNNDKVCKMDIKKKEAIEGDKVKNKAEKKKKKTKSEIKLNNSNNSKMSKTPKTQLRVISKAEWLRLKQEYLQTQKRKMAMLKEKIKEVREVVGVVNHNNYNNNHDNNHNNNNRYGNQSNHHNKQDDSNTDEMKGVAEVENIYPDGHHNGTTLKDTYSGKLDTGSVVGKENGREWNSKSHDGDGEKDGDDGKKNDGDGKKEKKDESSTPILSMVPNSIIKINLNEPVSKKFLKELLETRGAKVAFIEITDGETQGHVRVHDSKDAEVIMAADLAGVQCSLLQGDEEKAYWDKIFADRQLRLSTKHKKKQRGKDKVVRKADECVTALKKHHQHILFE